MCRFMSFNSFGFVLNYVVFDKVHPVKFPGFVNVKSMLVNFQSLSVPG